MAKNNLKYRLIKICEGEILVDCMDAIFPEPYIPYIPDKWNGVLVLAEAQNLAKSNDDYVATLKAMNTRQRIERLYYAVKTENRVRIQPWDDGSLKLAVAAALTKNPEETAVSNSVMWSLRQKNGVNRNPSKYLKVKSSNIWAKLLKEIKPKIVLTAGAVARSIIQPIWPLQKQVNLRLPSPIAMGILAGQTDDCEVESVHTIIQRMMKKYPCMFHKYSRFKELYIWHAIKTINKSYE
ncbi:MAG TPA: hypothetical protein DCX95_06510 [Elusimicrobia bacterium]|nr:hypothetical protein [Elusimicrobiota bacterium]